MHSQEWVVLLDPMVLLWADHETAQYRAKLTSMAILSLPWEQWADRQWNQTDRTGQVIQDTTEADEGEEATRPTDEVAILQEEVRCEVDQV